MKSEGGNQTDCCQRRLPCCGGLTGRRAQPINALNAERPVGAAGGRCNGTNLASPL